MTDDSLTPMMRQYRQIKQEHPDALLFFRLGDFYEMFFEDALLAARELEITLTSRNRDKNGIPVPMCGVPYHSAAGYIVRLIQNGHRVAICEQVEDPRTAVGIVKREVIRVITPGTLLDDLALEPKSHNYIASVHLMEGSAGVALADLSTGHFVLSDFVGERAQQELLSLISSFQPSEIIVPESQKQRLLQSKLVELPCISAADEWTFHADRARSDLQDQFHLATLEGLGIPSGSLAVPAAGGLLQYLRKTQKSALEHLRLPSYLHKTDFLRIDSISARNLELVQSVDGLRKWTLFSVVDFTQTGMGGRLLKEWLLRPSLKLDTIQRRQDAVEELAGNLILRRELCDQLSAVHDLERLLSRVVLGVSTPREMAGLGISLKQLPKIKGSLSQAQSHLLASMASLDTLDDTSQLLERALADDPPLTVLDGGVIRDGYHNELDGLRSIRRDGKSYIASIESRERARTRISSLKVKYNRVFGYFIEVTRSQLHLVPGDFMRKQTVANAERFITAELKEYEEKVLTAEERILDLERELFADLRAKVAAAHARIQASASAVAELDAAAALAEAAHRYRYCRPVVDDSTVIEIRNGRHPVLEQRDDQPFTPNDFYADTKTHQVLIITGPNMGGKSTFLRQNALIVILAQMGSFVPADSCRVGLVDQIFTRVGASDNLARGRSTFMVEMIETANILNNATTRSLILLDEVGRGTATFDGLSIAWSIAEFLHNDPLRKAKTIFATHYHELTKLERLYDGVKNLCVTVNEAGDDIVFLHKVMPGNADKSYGIEVARLAGLPQPVLRRAREILKKLERKEIDLSGQSRSRTTDDVLTEIQKNLF
ncbi:MAG TPA: DNA mismatch repair protein MutS [Acidobacteriota bacterium]|jgi:DNA mismatch repair protein MutS